MGVTVNAETILEVQSSWETVKEIPKHDQVVGELLFRK